MCLQNRLTVWMGETEDKQIGRQRSPSGPYIADRKMIRVDQRVYSNVGRNGHVREEWGGGGEPGREGAERAPNLYALQENQTAKIAQLAKKSKDSKRLKHRA